MNKEETQRERKNCSNCYMYISFRSLCELSEMINNTFKRCGCAVGAWQRLCYITNDSASLCERIIIIHKTTTFCYMGSTWVKKSLVYDNFQLFFFSFCYTQFIINANKQFLVFVYFWFVLNVVFSIQYWPKTLPELLKVTVLWPLYLDNYSTFDTQNLLDHQVYHIATLYT